MAKAGQKTLAQALHEAVLLLRCHKITFAIAGGIAASFYRKNTRTTDDIDIAILAENGLQLGQAILSELGYKIGLARLADLAGGPLFAVKRGSTTEAMLIGRSLVGPGLDFLLPSVPWVQSAVLRAQTNLFDLGFGPIPCLRVEDVILAKCISGQKGDRFKDLDDLKEILESNYELDFPYLRNQMHALKVTVPEALIRVVPVELRKLSRSVARARNVGKKRN